MSGKYYAVERNEDSLAHVGFGGGINTGKVRKNHKYVARVPKGDGKHRYFYSSFEVMAYKRAKAKGWGEGNNPNDPQQKIKPKKVSLVKGGKTALISAGARVYKGPSTGEGLGPEEKTKKKKKVKKATSKNASTRFASAYTPYVIRRGR